MSGRVERSALKATDNREAVSLFNDELARQC